ncbi:hypothetical protein FRB94_004251 [Tulasnella sp. JGI-2019a]|nr:hypothetical protein FRB93_000251 [Tulasnella sp. JGI-2019a]KAG9015132.1 hypothetical protein FRB94_004251 [Tulasnella sp. JGI-2019a]
MSTANRPTKAFVTLITTPSYLPGLLTLYHGMKAVNTKYPIVAMVPPQFDPESKRILSRQGIALRVVQPLCPQETYVLDEFDARFTDTWTKLRVFELVEYDRVVLMDADMTVHKNLDDLMDMDLPEGHIAAAHVCACNPLKLKHYPSDWIPENCAHTPMVAPDCLSHPPQITPDSPRPYSQLNSGLVVLRPSLERFEGIQNYLRTSPDVQTFKFPDQDLLSAVFRGQWKPLPYVYNGMKTHRNIHPNMWRDEDVRCLHYVIDKPWAPGGKAASSPFASTHSMWWAQWEALEKEMNADDGPAADKEGWKYVTKWVHG